MERKDMNDKPFRVRYFGDSHAKFFGKIPRIFQEKQEYQCLDIDGELTPGASVIGLGRSDSTLGLQVNILNRVSDGDHVVLNFGQVDIELGIYYRIVVKEIETDPSDFIEELVRSYHAFLEKLLQRRALVFVKGLNLTTLKSQLFGVNYVSRIISSKATLEERQVQRRFLLSKYNDFETRNRVALDFNYSLQCACRNLGVGYFDINHLIGHLGSYRGIDTSKGILEEFIPTGFDHHLVDSVKVRKIHYDGLLGVRAFTALQQQRRPMKADNGTGQSPSKPEVAPRFRTG